MLHGGILVTNLDYFIYIIQAFLLVYITAFYNQRFQNSLLFNFKVCQDEQNNSISVLNSLYIRLP